MAPVLRVGLFLSKDKKRKIKLPSGIDGVLCPPCIQFIEIEAEKPLEEQGPFDVIIQKVLEWDKNDVISPEKYARRLVSYCKQNPSVTLIDPVSSAELLIDRPTTLRLAEECRFHFKGRQVFVPRFVTYDGNATTDTLREKLQKSGIHFPVVCKSVCGAGHASEHAMSVVFSDEFLEDINYPCIVQQFVDHGGMMYKLYAVGDKYYICERPSIKDLKPCRRDTLHFNGSQVSKEGFNLPIHRNDVGTMKFRTSTNGELLDEELVRGLLQRLRKRLDTFLIGIDLIMDQRTGNIGIVDINYFPGYGGVLKQFQRDLFELLKEIGRRKGLVSSD